jgi:hypothetical protein
MTPFFSDRRGNRDILSSGAGILLLAGLLFMIANWYVKIPRSLAVPPFQTRVTYVLQRSADAQPTRIYFSLPSVFGFSRTVQPGDPKAVTTLGLRAADIRYLPRAPGKGLEFPAVVKPVQPAFSPWREEDPVFKPVSGLTWKMVVEPLEGPSPALPKGFEETANWPVAGAWTAVMRLEAGKDGKVRHVFLMPPMPDPALAAKVESLMRKARLEGGGSCRVKVSRVEVPTETGWEGAKQ